MGNTISGFKLAFFDNNYDDQDSLLPDVLDNGSASTSPRNYGAINGSGEATSSASTSTAPQSQNPLAEVLDLLNNIDEALSQTAQTVIANQDTQTVQATVDIFRTLISELQNPFLTPEQYDKYYAALLVDKTKLDTFKLALNAAPDKNAFLKQQLKQQVLEKLQNIQNLQASVNDASAQEEASSSNNNDQDSLLQHEAVPVDRAALDTVIDQFTSDESRSADYLLKINLEKYTEYSNRIDAIEAEIKRLNPHIPIIDWKAKKVLRGGMLANLIVSSGLGVGAAILFFQAAVKQLPNFCKLCEYEPSLEADNICEKDQPLLYVAVVYLSAVMASVMNSILASGFFSKYLSIFSEWLGKLVKSPRQAFTLLSVLSALCALATESIFLEIGGGFDSDLTTALLAILSSTINYPIDYMGSEYILSYILNFYQIRFGQLEDPELDNDLILLIQREIKNALQERVIQPVLQGQKVIGEAALLQALSLVKQHNNYLPLLVELLPDINQRISGEMKINRGSNALSWKGFALLCASSQIGYWYTGVRDMAGKIGGPGGVFTATVVGGASVASLPGLAGVASDDVKKYNGHTLLKLMHPKMETALKTFLVVFAIGSAFTAAMVCYDIVSRDSLAKYIFALLATFIGLFGTSWMNGIFVKGRLDQVINYGFERQLVNAADQKTMELVDTVSSMADRIGTLKGESLRLFNSSSVIPVNPTLLIEQQPAESLRLQQ